MWGEKRKNLGLKVTRVCLRCVSYVKYFKNLSCGLLFFVLIFNFVVIADAIRFERTYIGISQEI